MMNADPESRDAVTGVILAGGEARRMGGRDKGLIEIAGRPMVEYVIEALRPQVGALLINANRSRERYARFGYPVVADEFDGYNGPLAGMASCMRVAATDYIATLPCDSPHIPPDLVARLFLRLREEQADIGVAHNGERMQPVFSLIRRALLDSLQDYLDGGERKIDRWFERHATAVVDFSDRPDTFINVNTPEDVAKMEATLTHA
jgi:molybdopterin-guanine dinucleotide biosynthesis protein A